MEALSFPFVQRALVAVVLAAPLLGLLSPVVIARRLAFFSAALGQAALTGVAIGAWLGEPVSSPFVSVLAVSVLLAITLVALRRKAVVSPDTLVGVQLAFTLGLGVCLLTVVTKRFNVHQLESSLFGSVLTVTWGDVALLGVALLLTVAVIGPRLNRLLVEAVDERLAVGLDTSPAQTEYAFIVVFTLAVVVAVKVMGALMVEALVVVPAACAGLWAKSMQRAIVGSVVVALLAGVGGVVLSTQLAVPSGAAVVLCLTLLFVCSLPLATR
jgi:zinc transport system permease protein